MAQKVKKRIGLVFGGRSSEHQVSLTSAKSVLKAIDHDRFSVELICITQDGKWMHGDCARKTLEGESAETTKNVLVPPFPDERNLIALAPENAGFSAEILQKIDVFFPLLHGAFGEDGTIQGLFELAGVPYVGAGVAASAVGMDKILMKDIFRIHGLPVLESMNILRKQWRNNREAVLGSIAGRLPFPVFVKPANTGSSIGITKVQNGAGLAAALDCAAEFDRKLIVERGIDAREIECSVLGNDEPEASPLGEIIPGREFYDYRAKYIDDSSELVIPANLPENLARTIREHAVTAFKAIDCAGMARVDFLMERGTENIYVNEVNTIPGFTPISMYPKLWEAGGLTYASLLARLIELAVERNDDRKNCRTTYAPE